jgi:hypothetical protein
LPEFGKWHELRAHDLIGRSIQFSTDDVSDKEKYNAGGFAEEERSNLRFSRDATRKARFFGELPLPRIDIGLSGF